MNSTISRRMPRKRQSTNMGVQRSTASWRCGLARLPRELRTRSGEAHGRRERVDVVGTVMAAAVDEEGRRAGDAAQVGTVDVVRDPRDVRVRAQLRLEAVGVEAELLCVVEKIGDAKGILALEQ